jgi:hypothetical protein
MGFMPPTEEYQKKAAVWQSCRDAGIDPPPEVTDFFDKTGVNCGPDPDGMTVPIDEAVEDWKGDMESGIQVDVTKLPKGVRYIRFVNSW